MRRTVATLAVGATVALGLSGCGEGNVDTSKVESLVEIQAMKQTGISVKVHCPDEIPFKVGGEFHCIIRGGGERAVVTVTIENKDGDITWRTDQ